jgi:hypothetical protein
VVVSSLLVSMALAGPRPHPADVSWAATVPLWTNLSPAGKVIGAGPAAVWNSPPPAARLGCPQVVPPPGPTELPVTVTEQPLVVPQLLPPGTAVSRFASDLLPVSGGPPERPVVPKP